MYKKRNASDPANYRGIHLSAQLSKVVEKLLGRFFLPFLESSGAYGPNQWAYRKERGCKDALATNALQWVWCLHSRKKVGLYCSDVSGAFDKVETKRLVEKLRRLGVRGRLLRLLNDWLSHRLATVVVDGAFSREMLLENMVYQGTVWGPPLWNTYFADARFVAEAEGFNDTFFADDLNLFRAFPSTASNRTVKEALEDCQTALHKWGERNQVAFDAGKESQHILHRRHPEGENFRILGVLWDTKLTMLAECQEVAARAGWKLKTLLRTRRFFSLKDLVNLYKSHVLPILEFPTPALFHAATSVLELLDKVQRRFLREVGLSDTEALLRYNLAPLEARRDIAGLGLIHRTVLGQGPPQFHKWFFLETRVPAYLTRLQTSKHTRHLHDWLGEGRQTELLRRSLLGQVRTYNKLAQEEVDCKTVKTFQRTLQNKLKLKTRREEDSWQRTFSCRIR